MLHRDLKPDNIGFSVEEEGGIAESPSSGCVQQRLVLFDLGLSTTIPRHDPTFLRQTAAPPAGQQGGDEQVDVATMIVATLHRRRTSGHPIGWSPDLLPCTRVEC